jgi:hypothetical protein
MNKIYRNRHILLSALVATIIAGGIARAEENSPVLSTTSSGDQARQEVKADRAVVKADKQALRTDRQKLRKDKKALGKDSPQVVADSGQVKADVQKLEADKEKLGQDKAKAGETRGKRRHKHHEEKNGVPAQQKPAQNK